MADDVGGATTAGEGEGEGLSIAIDAEALAIAIDGEALAIAIDGDAEALAIAIDGFGVRVTAADGEARMGIDAAGVGFDAIDADGVAPIAIEGPGVTIAADGEGLPAAGNPEEDAAAMGDALGALVVAEGVAMAGAVLGSIDMAAEPAGAAVPGGEDMSMPGIVSHSLAMTSPT